MSELANLKVPRAWNTGISLNAPADFNIFVVGFKTFNARGQERPNWIE
jgi:hypothetical protein